MRSMGSCNMYVAILRDGFLLCALLAATGAAHGQGTGTTSTPVDDGLTFHGITLYGTVDVGLQYQTHGAITTQQAARISCKKTATAR